MMEELISRRVALLGTAAGLISSSINFAGAATSESRFENLDHEKFMRLAIKQALKVPKCPFGAVVVNIKTLKVMGEGWVRADKNPIWHGEMTAIYNCPDISKEFSWSDMALYTTGESCPMCQAAIVWTKMPLAVFGSSIPFLQSCGFGQIDIRAQAVVDAARDDYKGNCTIIGGILEKECNALFEKAKSL
ncbi:MAG: nucleoside deaminase [Candidatus Obscuribacterales bacterium]|nr:nucleoside deaminase [Candidatus Obscuribacterales bacterium]